MRSLPSYAVHLWRMPYASPYPPFVPTKAICNALYVMIQVDTIAMRCVYACPHAQYCKEL